MINNNGYIINEQLLNETQCQHKLKKTYLINIVKHVKKIFVIGVKDIIIIKLLN